MEQVTTVMVSMICRCCLAMLHSPIASAGSCGCLQAVQPVHCPGLRLSVAVSACRLPNRT